MANPQTPELKKIVWALTVGTLIIECIARTGISKPPLLNLYTSFLDGEVFLSLALIGTFFIYLWRRPPVAEVWITIGIGILVNAALATGRSSEWRTIERLILSSGYGFGGASLVMLAIQAYRSQGEARENRLITLMASSIIPNYVILVEFFLRLTFLHPLTYDRLLYALDEAYGGQISFVMGRLFLKYNLLFQSSLLIYLALPLAFSVLVALQISRSKRVPVSILVAFLMVGAVGYFGYHLCPAIGPRYMFGDIFPMSASPPATDLSYLAVSVDEPLRRNAMPSLHTAWVLILLLNSRWYARWAQVMAWIFVIFTLMGTVGLGEHYVIDLVVAVPFTIGIQAGCATGYPLWAKERRDVLIGAALMCLFWGIVIQWGVPLFLKWRVLIWVSTLVTLGMSFWLEWRLARALKNVECYGLT